MNIGLLMTYNEADIIDEMMAANRHFVDTIFVLDGSDDGTAERLAKYPEVELILKDQDVAGTEKVQDFHRQALLEAAHERYGTGHWFTLMHGDEIFYNNPRKMIERAEKQGAKRVNWAAMQFFMHLSDEPLDMSLPVQERLRWYSPFWVEIRQFKSSANTRYAKKHGQVIPEGVGWQPYSKMPIFKHYPYRSPEHRQRRIEQMKTRGFSGTSAEGTVYRETFMSIYKTARKFEDDFGDFELDRQGNLLSMMWRWRKLVKR
ncbi:MAG: glycosyltransferase family 2 protein [Trueperaceae bacterium]|nr:glycosyltransferase family 2 protein [Trueperaceae bacterium]